MLEGHKSRGRNVQERGTLKKFVLGLRSGTNHCPFPSQCELGSNLSKMGESYHRPDKKTLQALEDMANKLRIHSIESTNTAGSG